MAKVNASRAACPNRTISFPRSRLTIQIDLDMIKPSVGPGGGRRIPVHYAFFLHNTTVIRLSLTAHHVKKQQCSQYHYSHYNGHDDYPDFVFWVVSLIPIHQILLHK